MANQIFSFNSYVLSELGHLDKLVDVSTDLIPEEKEWNSWSIFHVISCSYPKMMHSVAFAMEWLKRGNYRIRKMQPSCLSSKMLPTIFVIKYDIMTVFFSFFCPIENDWYIFSIHLQRFHEFYIRQTQPEIKVLRKTLTEIHEQATLGPKLELLM